MASSNPTGGPGGLPYFGGAPRPTTRVCTNRLNRDIDALAGQFSTSSNPRGVTDTNWHHIAYSFRGSDNTLSAAVDGVSVTVSTIVPPPFNSSKTTYLLFSSWDAILVSGVRIVQGAGRS